MALDSGPSSDASGKFTKPKETITAIRIKYNTTITYHAAHNARALS